MPDRRSTTVACWLCAATALIASLAAATASAEDVPTPVVDVPALDARHALFAATLARVVTSDGIDYATLRADHRDLDGYRAQLAHAPPAAGRNERKALFIDAYNAWTIALVARELPADRDAWRGWSITSLGRSTESVWKRYAFELCGQRFTLDQVEHEVLRPLDDPRIHVAINCASRSCPALAAEPYVVDRLDEQLDAAAAAFAANRSQVRLEGERVRVNPILDWFGEDFAAVGGVRAFLLAHVPEGDVKQRLQDNAPIAFFDYDWMLNLADDAP
jgi:hypothetical protein